MSAVVVSADELRPDAELAYLSRLGGGAIASFVGQVRGDDGVTAIRLDHYPAMTQTALQALVDQAKARWPLLAVRLVHRVGVIALGEPIVFVGTMSDHRHAALESCAFLIDRLKTDAPFWKKEFLAGGEARWVAERSGDTAAASRWSA